VGEGSGHGKGSFYQNIFLGLSISKGEEGELPFLGGEGLQKKDLVGKGE